MKIKEVIRKKQNRLKKSLLGVLAVSAATVSLFPQTVMASGVSDVTQPLMNLFGFYSNSILRHYFYMRIHAKLTHQIEPTNL